MRRRLAQRQLALGGVAILGVAGSLAFTTRSHRAAAVLPPAVGSHTALAGSSGPQAVGTTTACGVEIGPATEGSREPRAAVRNPPLHRLPEQACSLSVIGRGPQAAGREFDLTDALARQLGVTGIQANPLELRRIGVAGRPVPPTPDRVQWPPECPTPCATPRTM